MIAATAVAVPVSAQVVTDGSLGSAGTVTSLGGITHVGAALGQQRGGNLFHSFSRFDIPDGESVVFSGPAGVVNVLARVTGGHSSSIQGTLACDIANANVYLINPAGVVFGPDAVINVSGSFVVTTADYVRLGTSGRFDAVHPSESVLASAAPAAFGFLGAPAGPGATSTIGVAGTPDFTSDDAVPAELDAAEGKTLRIVGGRVTVMNAILTAPAGRVDVAAVSSAGEVTFDGQDLSKAPVVPADVAQGDVTISGGSRLRSFAFDVDADGTPFPITPAGEIWLRGGAVTVSQGSRVIAFTADRNGGSIDIGARDLTVADASDVSTATYGGFTGGDVRLAVTDTLSLRSEGVVEVESLGAGNAGTLSVSAGTVHVDATPVAGEGTSDDLSQAGPTGLLAEADDAGMGGAIDVRAARLELINGAQITATTFGPGTGGTVTVNAETTVIDGRGFTGFTGIAANTQNPPDADSGEPFFDATGDAGAVTLAGSHLTILNGGGVSSNSLFSGAGRGGAVNVAVGDLTVDAGSTNIATGVTALSGSIFFDGQGVQQQISGGPGGNVSVNVTGLLREQNVGSSIRANATGDSPAGTVTVRAGRLEIDGMGATQVGGSNAGIAARVEQGAAGSGGAVDVQADSILITAGGRISATTGGAGAAGDIRVASPDLRLAAGGSIDSESELGATGAGGRVRVEAGALRLESGARIAASTASGGNAGDVEVIATDRVDVISGASIASATSDVGNAGNVTVQAAAEIAVDGTGGVGGLNGAVPFTGLKAETEPLSSGRGGDVRVETARLSLAGGGQVSTSTSGTGDGGSVSVFADDFAARGALSGLTASATILSSGVGRSGDIRLGAAGHPAHAVTLDSGAVISSDTFSTKDGGDVEVFADAMSLTDHAIVSAGSSGIAPGSVGGNGGTVRFTGGSLAIVGPQSQFATQTLTTGRAGSIDVRADRVLVDGTAGPDENPASTAAIQAQSSGAGTGGSITISGAELRLTNAGTISASNSAAGAGGTITLDVRDVMLDRLGSVLAATSGPAPGGDVRVVNPTSLRVTDALISTQTSGAGRGGDIAVTGAGHVEVARQNLTQNNSQLGPALSASTFAAGNGGSVSVQGDTLSLINGGRLESNSRADAVAPGAPAPTGDAGSVSVNATGDVRLTGGSSISVRAEQANAGDVSITASKGSIALSDARQNVESPAVAANRSLRDPTFEPSNTRVTAAAPNGTAGRIKFTALDRVSFTDSVVTAQARGLRNSGTGADDSAISIDPRFVVLGNSVINGRVLAPAGGGKVRDVGVFVDPRATYLQSSDSAILSNTTSLPVEVDIAGSLARLPASLAVESSLVEQCGARLAGGVSSFVVTGRSGSPLAPGGWAAQLPVSTGRPVEAPPKQ